MQFDFQLIAGNHEASMGATSGATATESSIAEDSRSKMVTEDVDDLDDALSCLADMVGKMMLDVMQPDTITQRVGPGSVWPTMSRKQITNELEIAIVAGSSGRPNRAQEIANLERLMPFLERLGGIDPSWLTKQVIERLDDHIDLTEAMLPNAPSMQTMQTMLAEQAKQQQPDAGPGGGATPPSGSSDPRQQGGQGVDKGERPRARQDRGPQPAFGDSGAMQG